MKNRSNYNLAMANAAFRNKDFEKAIEIYEKILSTTDIKLKKFIVFNLEIARRKVSEKRPAKIENKGYISSYNDAFDAKFYTENYPDITESGVDPFEHYSSWGWKEGRLPNQWFDPLYYLEKYPEVKKTNKDPLLDYVEDGQFKNRETRIHSISKLNKGLLNEIPRIKFDNTKENFIEYEENKLLDPDVKIIAFYLPQFHPFPENDKWWGRGFTEWYNVTKATPNYSGHHQPHLPIHNGFYDLRIPEILYEQARLAKNYGIYGFNFYYYWFDGKILMHKPFEMLLQHKDIDINYCLTWANENWTRRWDGAEEDVLIAQNHSEHDSIRFIESLYKHFRDGRYIKIQNKPVLIVYRPNIIPEMELTLRLWRRKVKEAGFSGIYLIGAQTFGFKDPNEYGFDAAMEFPPHTVQSNKINKLFEIKNDEYDGVIYSYEEVVKNACANREYPFKNYRTAMLSWDNTARKQNNSHIFEDFSLLKYKQWLSHIAAQVYNNANHLADEKIVFINAWNEWAEGTHLEPDRKYGYGYLKSTFDVIKNFDKKNTKYLVKEQVKRNNNYAIILHIHYTEIWQSIVEYLGNLEKFGFDLYITTTSTENSLLSNIKNRYPNANIFLSENRGRDIRPFIHIYKEIKSLGYVAICKIHTKKSIYREDGCKIRDEIFDSLLGSSEKIGNILHCFEKYDSRSGLICKDKYLIKHNDKNMYFDRPIVNDLAVFFGIDFRYSHFPAGSMFWFRPEALNGIEKIPDSFFELEEGLADGTVAHSIERLFCLICESNGYSSKTVE